METIYKATSEYFGYQVFFYFEDPLEAVKYKEAIEKIRPQVSVVIQAFRVLKDLPPDFVDDVLEILKEVDRRIEERRAKENESVPDVPCATCD